MFSVKLAYILLLGVVCCSASRAHEFSNMPRDVMKSLASATVENKTAESASEKADQGRVLSRLTPTQKDDEERHGIQSLEPVGIIGDISAKWADLQSRFRWMREYFRSAALVPPTVPGPHANSYRLLNLAGSAKVVLGWPRSIAR